MRTRRLILVQLLTYRRCKLANWVDVSWFNGKIDPSILTGVEGMMIRASDGVSINAEGLTNSVDLNFATNLKTALSLGIKAGAYHVLEPTQPLEAQAELFVSLVGKAPICFALDVETSVTGSGVTPQAALAMIDQWLSLVKAATSKPALVYASGYTLEWLGQDPTYLWFAEPGAPTPSKACVLWQTGTAQIPGIENPTDTDVWCGTSAQMQDLFGGQVDPTISDYPLVALLPSVTGKGYLAVAQDGGTFNFGDQPWLGSCYTLGLTGLAGARPLDAPIVAAAITSTGKGYWLVGADGGVFNFGDAPFFGSCYTLNFTGLHGTKPLPKPVCSIAKLPDDLGYWLLAQDGTIFNFGAAQLLSKLTVK